MNRTPIAALLVALLFVPAAGTARAACESSVGGDQKFIETQLAVLKSLVPALPPGWSVYETRTTPLVRQTHCREGEAGAYPAPATVQCEVTALPANAPQFHIRDLDEKRELQGASERAEMARATRHVQAAAHASDLAALQRANAEMQEAIAHAQASQSSALAAVRAVDSLRQKALPVPLRLTITVNPATISTCPGWTTESAPGTFFAARFDAPPGCTTGPFAGADVKAASVRGYGDWHQDGERWTARFEQTRTAREVPLYARYTLWVVIRGGDAAVVGTVAAKLDAARAAAQLDFARAE